MWHKVEVTWQGDNGNQVVERYDIPAESEGEALHDGLHEAIDHAAEGDVDGVAPWTPIVGVRIIKEYKEVEVTVQGTVKVRVTVPWTVPVQMTEDARSVVKDVIQRGALESYTEGDTDYQIADVCLYPEHGS